MLQHDHELVKQEGAELDLRPNHLKSEVVCSIHDVRNSILSFLPGSSVVDPLTATLLCSPIDDERSISSSLSEDSIFKEDGGKSPSPLDSQCHGLR